MFIDRAILNQLNKDIFGGGLIQTKKIRPDYGKLVMPDPRLPRIRRFQFTSNNPLGTLQGVMTGSMVAGPQIPMPQEPITQPMEMQQESLAQPQNIEQETELTGHPMSLHSEKVEPEPIIETPEQPIPAVPAPAETPTPPPQAGAYSIKGPGDGTVKVPPGYSSDDEGEIKLIDLLNEELSNFELAIDKSSFKVYKRQVCYFYFYNIKNIYREKEIH